MKYLLRIRITILFILIFSINNSIISQNTLIIGNTIDGTFNSGLTNAYSAVGWNATLYPSELFQNNTGYITKIAFNVESDIDVAIINQKMYFKEVPYDYFSTSERIYPDSIGAQLVFDDSINWPNKGWKTLDLDSYFLYNGGNLLVIFEDYDSSYVGSLSFQTTYQNNPKVSKGANSFSATLPTGNGYMFSEFTNIKFTLCPIVSNNICIDSWISPQTNVLFQSSTPITVKVRNCGTQTQDSIPIRYSVDNGTTYSYDTIFASILPQATYDFTFSNSAYITEYGHPIVTVENIGDTIYYDNTSISKFWMGHALGGNYSIGANTQNDFNNINDAVNILKQFGMSSSVILNLDSGVFNEKVVINGPIAGSPTYSITIKGQGENTIIIDTNTEATSEVFIIKNISNIILDSVSIRAESSIGTLSNLWVENCNNVKIRNCKFDIPNIVSEFGDNVNIKRCNSLLFENNIVIGGRKSIWLYGNSTNKSINNKIINNKLINFYYMGLYSIGQIGAVYEGNYINNGDNQIMGPYGISLYGVYLKEHSDSCSFSNNRIIIAADKMEGLKLNNITGSNTSQMFFRNNIISVNGGKSGASGLQMEYCSYINLYNNSINLDSKNNIDSKTIYIKNSNSSNNRLVNNNIINYSMGYALYTSIIYGFIENDYNNYYTGSNNRFIKIANHSKSNIAQWKAWSINSQHSLEYDPMFYLTSDLHSKSLLLNDSGVYISQNTTDIDGDVRSLTNPDIGADEYSPIQNDIGIIKWNNPITGSSPNNNNPISIRLFNFGTNSQTNIPVHYSIDDGQTYITEVIGTIIQPYSYLDYSFSTTANMSNTGTYNCIATVNHPNDQDNNNDTIRHNVFICNTLSGTYTLGSDTLSDFNYFADLSQSLLKCGISGPVIIQLDSAIYDEQIELGTVDNSSSTNTITIKGKGVNKTIITNSNTNMNNKHIVKLVSAKHYKFDSISFVSAQGVNYTWGIHFYQSSSNIDITNCEFNLGDNFTKEFVAIKSYTILHSALFIDSILIKNNKFIGGADAIYLSSQNPYTYGVNNKIINNKFENQYRNAIWLKNQKNTYISSNTIVNSDIKGTTLTGISLSNARDSISIKGNKIDINGKCGFFIDTYSYSNNFTLCNNFVNIKQNNSIHFGDIFGLNFNNLSNVSVYNNTVKVDGVIWYNGSANTFRIHNPSYMNVINNIFINNVNGLIFTGDNHALNLNYDYNNLISNASIISKFEQSNNTYTFSQWKQQVNSTHTVSINPTFVSSSDMHSNSITMDNLGTNVGIIHDIDGDIRSTTTPDIGADEYTYQAISLGNNYKFCEGDSVVITSNLGNNFTYLWIFNGDTLSNSSSSVIIDTSGIINVKIVGSLESDSAIIEEILIPFVNLGTDTTIKSTSGTIILDAGNPDASWIWNTADTTQFMLFSDSNLQFGANEIWVKVIRDICYESDTIVINLLDDTYVKVNNNNDAIISIYPNPNNGNFTLDIEQVKGNARIEIMNYSGKVIYQKEFTANGSHTTDINVSDMAKGIYILSFIDENRSYISKFVVK